jgi:chromosome partitioning protein
MKVITFLNSKGGVGKTTLAINIERAIRKYRNVRIVMVDADRQCSLTDWYSAHSESHYPPPYTPVVNVSSRQTLQSAYQIAAQSKYDYMIIDTAGKTQDMLGTALTMSDLAIIPIKPSALDVWSSIDTIDLLQSAYGRNPTLKAMLVLNQAIRNSTLNMEVASALAEIKEAPRLSPNFIHGRVAYARTINEGNTVFDSNDEAAKQEISSLTEEILGFYND